MNIFQRFAVAGAILSFTIAAHAEVTCSTHPATAETHCVSDTKGSANADAWFYVSNYEGRGPSLILTLEGMSSRWDVATIVVRVDGGKPIRMPGFSVGGKRECDSSGCKWKNGATAKPTPAQWHEITKGRYAVAALVDRNGRVSEAVDIDPRTLAEWLAEFSANGVKPD